jgi:hypothetical protein
MKKRGLLFVSLLAISLFLISFISAGTFRVTEEHPFLVNGEWISASQLVVGDVLSTVDGKQVRITSLEDVVSSENFSVYNLEAGVYHNFVVGLDRVIVHNSNAVLPRTTKPGYITVRHYFDAGGSYPPEPSLSMAEGLEKDLYLYGSQKMGVRKFFDRFSSVVTGNPNTAQVRDLYVTTRGVNKPITFLDLYSLMGKNGMKKIGYVEFDIPMELYNSWRQKTLLDPTEYWNAYKLYGWQHGSTKIPVVENGLPIAKNGIHYFEVSEIPLFNSGSLKDFGIYGLQLAPWAAVIGSGLGILSSGKTSVEITPRPLENPPSTEKSFTQTSSH